MRASPAVPNPVARARRGLAEAEQVVKAAEAEPERFGHLVEKKRPSSSILKFESYQATSSSL